MNGVDAISLNEAAAKTVADKGTEFAQLADQSMTIQKQARDLSLKFGGTA